MRILPRRLHAILDYPFYLGLIVVPILLGLGTSHAMAFVLPMALGVVGLVVTALTKHECGMLGVIGFRGHLAFEAVAGMSFLTAAVVYQFAGLDLILISAAGGVLLGLSALSRVSRPLIPAE